MPPAIKIENLSKQYRLGTVGTGTLSHDLKRWWTVNVLRREDPYLKIGETNDREHRGDSDYVWALRDINLEVEEGEVLGIIGKNGAGKSTLLKILSKVTTPTTGSIKARGRIASLLEVGTGFHPEMTGRENIFMNGAIMGMTKAEIKRKFDEIVDFAGVERYIDTPVKRYSSGMTVRLGFAVAAHLEPEILVVDEVLAVGDAEFQKKAIGKMQDVSRNQGRTVLFVSHNMGAVKQLCTDGLLLNNGRVEYLGDNNSAIEKYMNFHEHVYAKIIDGIKFCHNDLIIDSIKLNDSEQNVVEINQFNHVLRFEICGILKARKSISVELRLFDNKQVLQAIYSPGHLYSKINTFEVGRFEINETITLPENMTKGEFILDFVLTLPNIETYVEIPGFIKLISQGIIGQTGLEFNYEYAGLLMLK